MLIATGLHVLVEFYRVDLVERATVAVVAKHIALFIVSDSVRNSLHLGHWLFLILESSGLHWRLADLVLLHLDKLLGGGLLEMYCLTNIVHLILRLMRR